MPITDAQWRRIGNIQKAAGQDPSPQVRLIAGPGTGKSRAIEERVKWLLEERRVTPSAIRAVSFTRASSRDLESRVRSACAAADILGGDRVRVSTLHSLAAQVLAKAGVFRAGYPVAPSVLDDWEQPHIFDAEFSYASSVTPSRAADIRGYHEAIWSTGRNDHPNYDEPNPPVSAEEREEFVGFHRIRTQTYSCVLPGELVRQCVERIETNTLRLDHLAPIRHIIVDEYQDLNPMDIEFIDHMARIGIDTWIAGDDDQSIYSFRYATPAGIQSFTRTFPDAARHSLTDCARSTTAIVDASRQLLARNSGPDRIPKDIQSLYAESDPPLAGVVHRWHFEAWRDEARAIAKSCSALITSGLDASEIMILLSNRRALWWQMRDALKDEAVPFSPPKEESWNELPAGRYLLAILRASCNEDDYIAHRTLFGLQKGVGPATTDEVVASVLLNGGVFVDVIRSATDLTALSRRAQKGIDDYRAVWTVISDWTGDDTLGNRRTAIEGLVGGLMGDGAQVELQNFIAPLPPETTLRELRDYVWADNDEQRLRLIRELYRRADLPEPTDAETPENVRVMTIHGAKGLDAAVVFVPALEAEILPGPRRQPIPSRVLEAARMLYVAITRAKVACVLSFADERFINGVSARHTPSDFASHVGGAFELRIDQLTPDETQQILTTIARA